MGAVSPAPAGTEQEPARDPWIQRFLAHLAADRGASVYTQRNYRQALVEFHRWHQEERQSPPPFKRPKRAEQSEKLSATVSLA